MPRSVFVPRDARSESLLELLLKGRVAWLARSGAEAMPLGLAWLMVVRGLRSRTVAEQVQDSRTATEQVQEPSS